ncbi:MAG: hypothetical protein KGL39_21270 [Patescibacteria group bacterium]|nr:hypothetical protein [Patescibacteria group bacterium]
MRWTWWTAWTWWTLAALSCLGQSEINPGQTFQDGQLLTAAELQNLVGNATILPAFFTDKPGATFLHNNDEFLLYSLGAAAYYTAPFSVF